MDQTNLPVTQLTQIDTNGALSTLRDLFQTITSGKDYNREQVKNAVAVSNAMVKMLRFEFDVYKYFDGRRP